MKISKGTIARTIVYIIALVNMALTVAGKNPLPYPSEDIENAFTIILDCGAGLIAAWKNNSFTKEAIISDVTMLANKKLQKLTKKSEDEHADLATANELSNGKESNYVEQ